MIPVTPPKGAVMAYRLDPYSLDLLPATKAKGKSMHDVVEPTVVFWHRRSNQGSPYGRTPKSSNASTLQSHPNSLCSTPSRGCSISPPPPSAASPTGGFRLVTVGTRTLHLPRVVAPFRVTVGDQVVVQTPTGDELLAVVTCVSPQQEICSPEKAGPTRLLRKAREGDRTHDANVHKHIGAVLSRVQQLVAASFHQDVLSFNDAEYSLDASVLFLAPAACDLPEQELAIIQRMISTEFRCEARITGHTASNHSVSVASYVSSPNLSDTCSSIDSSSRSASVLVDVDEFEYPNHL